MEPPKSYEVPSGLGIGGPFDSGSHGNKSVGRPCIKAYLFVLFDALPY